MSEDRDVAPQASEPTDRKSLLSAALDAAESETAAAPSAPSEGERARDERGRFAPKEPTSAETAAAPEPEEPQLWQRPPNSWKKDYHEPWQTVDPKLREYIWQREQEMAAGVEPLKTRAQFADQVEKTIAPYLPIVQGLGIEPLQAIQGLMENDRILRYGTAQEKASLVLGLINYYGIDVSGIDQSQIRPPDPAYQALQQQIMEMRGQMTAAQQATAQAEEAEMLRAINTVAPQLEHFERVRPAMVEILSAGLVPEGSFTDMAKAAYEKAVRLDDELWQEVQSAHKAATDLQQRQAADQAAKQARRAAVSPASSTPGAPSVASKAQDRRTMLEEQFGELGQRL